MGRARILLRLAARGLRHRWLRATGLPALPEALSVEVTRRCVARCVMCNIWRTAPGPELAARDWLALLGSPALRALRELDVTGGEPFLRDDLVELLLGVGGLKARHLTRLRSVAITTNGLLTRKVLRDVGAVLTPLERTGVALVFACGMDAVGEVHDRIRGHPGAWAKLDATLEGLVALREEHPSLVLGVKTTVTRHNVAELERICEYAERRGLFTIISPYILTSNRYANLDREDALSLSPGDAAQLQRFYEGPRFRWSLHRRELVRFLATGQMEKPCSAGMNYFFVRSSGDLFPCPIAGTPALGNVQQAPFEELIRSAAAARFRRRVGSLPECRVCTEPGLERYALTFEGFHYLRQYFREGRDGFLTLHRHLGLDKYFG
jgi:MoaA/NifB/PqqE/SkfB family radical SAM enzyme